MAGTLSVQTIQGLATAPDPTTISIPAGYKLVAADTGGIVAPGSVINFGSYNTGYGSGARLSSNSQTWQTLRINGTNQAPFGSISKRSSDSLYFNKVSNNSHLAISLNFPSYNGTGGAGHGVRLQHSVDNSTFNLLDILTNGPAHAWGWGGYGGATATMNNFTWCTYDNSTYRENIRTLTGNFSFYFEVYVWSSGDTVYFNDYEDAYPKYGTIQVWEVAA